MSDPKAPAPTKPAAKTRSSRALDALARFNARWMNVEGVLCAVILVLEVAALVAWVALRGLSTATDAGSNAGLVFRALLGAVVLGGAGYASLRARHLGRARVVATSGVVIGVLIAPLWSGLLVSWSSNLLNWLQQASSLALWGGLRGIGTRLTLLLALLGGSLATASGRHITIDLVTRFVGPRVRIPISVTGWLGAALICAVAGWGFFDHIAIEDFGARADSRDKVGFVARGLAEDAFIFRKQLSLDARSLPHVLSGNSYSEWLKGREWNQWLDEAGFAERYGKSALEPLKIPADATRTPIVVVPEQGEPRGQLMRIGNLFFPLGLFVIALRFVILALLALGGRMPLAESDEPKLAHGAAGSDGGG
jgi:TRAP-type C4-dicarboxylate transport system permease small subunit